ncbi:MAG: DUF1573 domain-containing protein [Flavobacteriaceae bacterium]|jgi:hypothetical protein
MKNLTTFLLPLLIFVAFTAQGQTTSNAAEISFEEKVFDYGTITKGADGNHTFTFTNTGNSPLIIESVKSSCGCTVPKKPEAPIAPGASGSIQVRYDTQRLGVFRKTITVTTNAGTNSVVALKIKGTVVE